MAVARMSNAICGALMVRDGATAPLTMRVLHLMRAPSGAFAGYRLIGREMRYDSIRAG